jgi:hypothetical protein
MILSSDGDDADVGFQLHSMMRSRERFLTSLKCLRTTIGVCHMLLWIRLVNWLGSVGGDPEHAR